MLNIIIYFIVFCSHILVAVFYGTLYWKIGDAGDPPSKYTDRLSLFFFSLTFMILGHQQSIPQLFDDRLLFYRERGAGLYGCIPYWFSAWFLKLILAVINVFIYSTILYLMVGLYKEKSIDRFFFFNVVLMIQSITSLFLCQLIAAISSSVESAINYFPISLMFSMAFSGYIVYIPKLPLWYRSWAPCLSFLRWGFQALVLNEMVENKSLRYGSLYVQQLGFDKFNKYQCIPYMLIFMIFSAIALLLMLKYVNFERR